MKRKNKDKVFEIYDEIIDWFDEHRNKELVMEKYYLDLLQKHTPLGGEILDVGCGTGEPLAKFLLEKGYKVLGIDASKKMIARCQQRFPEGQWLLMDMRHIEIPKTFDVVIAWHSLFHLPHDDQRATLRSLTSLLKPSGLLFFTSGPEYDEVWGENGGYDLYHASLSTEEYKQILTDNHLRVLVHKIEDPVCGDATVWVAQKIQALKGSPNPEF